MKLRTAGGRLKNETIKYGKKHSGHRINCISSNHWGGEGGSSIPAFASGVDLPVGAALGGFGVVLSLLTVLTRSFSRSPTVRQGKHDAIMLLAQSKLDSIADIISQAMQDGDISLTKFHKVLQEREKYRKLKADIRNRTKAKVKQIEKEQREEILEQGRKEGKILQIANSSGVQCQCHLKYKSLPLYGM